MLCRVLLSLCCFLIISCESSSVDIYNTKNYSRITTPQDSIKNMYVVYQSNFNPTRFFLRSYWDNGKPQTTTYFHNKKKDGPVTMFLDNGVLIFAGRFNEDKEEGSHKYYNSKGIIEKMEEFSQGRKIKTSYYNLDGKLDRVEMSN